MFEKHISRFIFGSFNGFYQNFSCRTHQNFAKKPGDENGSLQIRTHHISARKTEFSKLHERIFWQDHIQGYQKRNTARKQGISP